MPQQRTAYKPTPANPNTAAPATADTKIVDETDEMLDEIDAVLAEEEEFAIHYVQKGGQ